MRLAAALALLAAACAAAQDYDETVYLACRPGLRGALACRVLDRPARDTVAVAAEAGIRRDVGADVVSLWADQQPDLDRLRRVLAMVKVLARWVQCGERELEGHVVSYCATQHRDSHLGRTVWSAYVTVMGRSASNRDFRGRDLTSAQDAIGAAADHWLRMHAK